MIYLASPYTHEYKEVMELRYQCTMDIVVQLINKRIPVYSPIVHYHVLANKYDLPVEYNFWQHLDRSAIVCCSAFMIAKLDGWDTSTGVRDEYSFALAEGKEISTVEYIPTGKYIIIHRELGNPFPDK